MAYTDKTALKIYLGISASDDDTLLDALILRAQAIIDAQCGRTFEALADSTRYFDACAIHGDMLYLDGDLCAITTVTNGDSAAIAGTEYTAQPRNVTPWFALRMKAQSAVGWNGTDGEIAIVGKWAYATAAPATIVQACTRLAAYLYRQKDNHADLDRATVVGNMTILPARFPSDIADMLRPYRRLVP